MDHLPIQSCLVLHSFALVCYCSLFMWLMVSFLSPHNQHLLFNCVLCIFALTKLVFMSLLSTVIRKDSLSLERFPFLSHVHVFLCEISLVCRLKYPHSCFSSNSCFLVFIVLLIFMLPVVFLVAIISLSLPFLCSFRVPVLICPRYLQCWLSSSSFSFFSWYI